MQGRQKVHDTKVTNWIERQRQFKFKT